MLEKRREGSCVHADYTPQSDLICTSRERLGRSDADMAIWPKTQIWPYGSSFAFACSLRSAVKSMVWCKRRRIRSSRRPRTKIQIGLILRACLFFALNYEIYGMVQEKADKAKSQFNGKKTKSFGHLSLLNSLMELTQPIYD